MKSKIAQAVTGIAVLGAGLGVALQSAPAQAAGSNCRDHHFSVNQRQTRQQDRIFQGVRSGELTNHEAFRLEDREANIDRVEAHDRASGGKFTWQERRNIERREDRASHAIYDQKHDRQTR